MIKLHVFYPTCLLPVAQQGRLNRRPQRMGSRISVSYDGTGTNAALQLPSPTSVSLPRPTVGNATVRRTVLSSSLDAGYSYGAQPNAKVRGVDPVASLSNCCHVLAWHVQLSTLANAAACMSADQPCSKCCAGGACRTCHDAAAPTRAGGCSAAAEDPEENTRRRVRPRLSLRQHTHSAEASAKNARSCSGCRLARCGCHSAKGAAEIARVPGQLLARHSSIGEAVKTGLSMTSCSQSAAAAAAAASPVGNLQILSNLRLFFAALKHTNLRFLTPRALITYRAIAQEHCIQQTQ